MSIAGRVERLERATGRTAADGICYCGGLAGKVIRIYDGPDSDADADCDTQEPPACEECGGSRELLKIVVIDLRAAEAA